MSIVRIGLVAAVVATMGAAPALAQTVGAAATDGKAGNSIEKSGYPAGQSAGGSVSPTVDHSGSGKRETSQDAGSSHEALPQSISSFGVSGLGALKASME